MFRCLGGHCTKKWRALAGLVLCLYCFPWGLLGEPCDQVHAPQIKRLPHPQMLIGIGSPKSGTTFIYNALKSHPKIVRPGYKELHFFDTLGEPTQAAYEKYLGFWGDREKWGINNTQDGVLLEITPRYMGMYDVPCLIKHFTPDAKFIVTLRHPADRVMSHITMHRSACMRKRMYHKNEPISCCQDTLFDMASKIGASIQNMKDSSQQCLNVSSPDPWFGCSNDKLKPIDRDVYSTQIAHWFKVFPPSQFIFINANELFKDPVKQLNRILEFVGLPTDWDLDQYVDDVKHYAAPVKHVDPDEKAMREMIKEAFKGPLEDLYRLLKENGIDFSPLKPDPHHSDNIKVKPLSELQAKCCTGGCPFPSETYDTSYQTLKRNKTFIDFNNERRSMIKRQNSTDTSAITLLALTIFPVCSAVIYWVWRKKQGNLRKD